MKKLCNLLVAVLTVMFFAGCVSLQGHRQKISRRICAPGIKSSSELYDFFMAQNPSADPEEVLQITRLYVSEAADEGINSDVAFVQMCHETGFLKFGGLVTSDMHNYCGLGSIDSSATGARFDTMEEGVRAHIQHLHAYGTTEEAVLHHELIDPRYSWPHKAYYVEDIQGLAKKWATDPDYSVKLEALLVRLENF